MARHTSKFRIKHYATEEYDIEIYSSGGETHTVVIQHVDGGAAKKKSFTGVNSCKRATDYANTRFEEYKAADESN